MIEIEELEIRYEETVAVRGVSFCIDRGEHVTLLGPSGCGKTSILRAIAGLEQPSAGTIRIAGETMYSSSIRRNVPAEKRGISMVFQSYAIWPHMSVFDNVAYGLSVRKVSAAELKKKVAAALELVQMREFAMRPAAALSGGQQQRVALARALAFSPDVVLFDEPLSNLDARLRSDMRRELRELQQRLAITSLYVTHDQEEALAISDRVIVMNHGRVEQVDSPQAIYDRPRSEFVADFVGSANLIRGSVMSSSRTPGPVLFQTNDGTLLRACAIADVDGSESIVAIRTAYIVLGIRNSASHENNVRGRVARRMFHGDFVEYVVEWAGGSFIVRRPPTESFDEGMPVVVSFLENRCVLLQRTEPTATTKAASPVVAGSPLAVFP